MDFENHLQRYLNKEEISSLLDSLNKSEQKGLLLNLEKMSEEIFLRLYPKVVRHPFVPHAFLYNRKDYDFGCDIHHDLGCYYIQDPSAMLVSYFLAPSKDETVLDLCAAPGGKTVQASLLMQHSGILLANDLSRSRTQILLSNIERMGLDNVAISNLDFEKVYDNCLNAFDKIILDAPCSGSGMFRRSQEMKDDWTYEKVLANAKIQRKLLEICYQMLKPGGKLIYSTCSYSYEEDEEVILEFIKRDEMKTIHIIDSPLFYRSKELPDAIHLFPHLFPGEGHFICLLQKNGKETKLKESNSSIVERKVLMNNGKYGVERFRLTNKLPSKLVELSLRPGLFLGTKTKDDFIPSHHFSRSVNSSNEMIELDENELKLYLHGDVIRREIEDGYHVVSYKKIPLGIVRAKSHVLKNLYPKGLRR